MTTLDALINTYLKKHDITSYRLAEDSGVKKQRISDMLNKGSCPSDKNFKKLLAVMKLNKAQKQQFLDAHMRLKTRNADKKLKDGRFRRLEAQSRKLLNRFALDVDILVEHSSDNKRHSSKQGLHSILQTFGTKERKKVLRFVEMQKDIGDYQEYVAKKSQGKVRYTMPDYVTRAECMITLRPLSDKDTDKRFVWLFSSIFDGCFGDRVRFQWHKRLGDTPLCWDEGIRQNNKGHLVKVMRWFSPGPQPSKCSEQEFRRELRSTVNLPVLYFTIWQELKKTNSDTALSVLQNNSDSTFAIDDVSQHVEELFQHYKQSDEKPSTYLLSQLEIATNKLRSSVVQQELKLIMTQWASRYFEKCYKTVK